VQQFPDGHLDLWGRDHRKSTVITFGKSLQDILASHGDDPLPEWKGLEPTFGLFSHTRPIAKSFLRQLKREMETNDKLKALFPDVLWGNPEKEAPTWSEDSGLVVRRKTNPKEATVEAWGVVDGQPTAKHFDVIVDDDVVTLDSVSSPEQIAKTTTAWSLHLNLGTANTRLRVVGTRYHFADSYRAMLEREAVKPRIRPATIDGTLTGEPVFLSREQFEKKAREMGPYVASAQLLLNPTSDSRQVFKREWIRRWEARSGAGMNLAMLIDPANAKTRTSDYTAIAVIGKAKDENYYLLDAVRDRLSLRERIQFVMDLHRKWRPSKVGYEKYGLQADIDYLKEVQERETYRFDVSELGGTLSKADRINRLIPAFADGSFYLPESLSRTLHDGKTVDVIHTLVEEELLAWPVPAHDDLLDAMARIFDIDLPWPRIREQERPERYSGYGKARGRTWMSG
jgi:predicted phage terminase large subunit-like protein